VSAGDFSLLARGLFSCLCPVPICAVCLSPAFGGLVAFFLYISVNGSVMRMVSVLDTFYLGSLDRLAA